jgi:hypothetical protein
MLLLLAVPSAPRSRKPLKKAAHGGDDGSVAVMDCKLSTSAAGIASASAAAAEKAAAGENKAVEHVALVADKWTEGLMFGHLAQEQQNLQHMPVGTDTPPPPMTRGRSSKRQRAG